MIQRDELLIFVPEVEPLKKPGIIRIDIIPWSGQGDVWMFRKANVHGYGPEQKLSGEYWGAGGVQLVDQGSERALGNTRTGSVIREMSRDLVGCMRILPRFPRH